MTTPIVLNSKPLVEAIFEIRWELTGENSFAPGGPQTDPSYDVMVGTMREKLKTSFPTHVRLPAAQIPGIMMPYQPQHQFRAKNGWPLVQLGSGVLTINETETYSSTTFMPMCLEILEAAISFWKETGSEPRIVHVALRYIDAIVLGDKSIQSQLHALNVDFGFGERIVAAGKFADKLEAFQLATRMKSVSPDGYVDLIFSRGQKANEDALIWETMISSDGEQCGAFDEAPHQWLTDAHTLAHDLFFSMIEGELLEKFK